jgi:hypothetical protein
MGIILFIIFILLKPSYALTKNQTRCREIFDEFKEYFDGDGGMALDGHFEFKLMSQGFNEMADYYPEPGCKEVTELFYELSTMNYNKIDQKKKFDELDKLWKKAEIIFK